MKLLMKKKIKITRDKYEKISKLYRFGGFAIIVGLLISFSSLIGKPVEFLCIFLPYFITKNFYAKQYHAKSLKNCFAYSLLIFGFATLTTLPKEISISFSILLGVLIAFISYKIGDIQFKLKDYEYISDRYEKLLKNQFKFNSNIICNIGADIDNAEVFRSFAETERYFTLASLINLKEQIGIGNIYFDNVNEVASRINVKDYVPNNALVFNVDEIDALLERIIIGNMASIKEASNFAIYPSTCYPWTEYLLESYVAKYSQKFSLLHICYAESKCAGAIVKRSSQIDSMDAVVVEYLVVHPEIQSGNEALNGLVEDGYIARKRYKNIEDLLVIAKAKRRV